MTEENIESRYKPAHKNNSERVILPVVCSGTTSHNFTIPNRLFIEENTNFKKLNLQQDLSKNE